MFSSLNRTLGVEEIRLTIHSSGRPIAAAEFLHSPFASLRENAAYKHMRSTWTHLFAFIFFCFSGLAFAAGEYDPQKVCPNINPVTECDHLIERTVSKEVPGVIERQGPVLRIQAKNGKTIERVNSKAEGEGHKETWVCDYFPTFGFVRVCYRFWESSGTEFVNIHSGNSTFVNGWPIYSPSGQQILMVNGYGGEVYSLEIWRFGEKELLNEFSLASPLGQGWEVASWKSEREIESKPEPSASGQRKLVKESAGWVLRGQ